MVHSSGFRTPLYLRSLPAPLMLVWLGLVYGGAALCVAAAGLPIWLRFLLLTLTLILMLLSYRQARSMAATTLVINARDDWFLILPTGQTTAVQPASALIPGTAMVLLVVREQTGRRHAFVITSWNTDPDSLRRLRVRLRYRLDPGRSGGNS